MTAIAMPAPARLDPPPPIVHDDDGDPGRPPAPGSSMLAALARIASHAGEPLSATVTQPLHAITVNLADRQAYAAWRAELGMIGAVVRDDDLGVIAESTVRLYGWTWTVQIAGSS